ncbi:MAG: hypothetical protein LBM93_04915 [Oscillospiraceae bacterium]|jgi:hypothetical protein|nr:hypothetical protein [Oscillospiraceae bacterium]
MLNPIETNNVKKKIAEIKDTLLYSNSPTLSISEYETALKEYQSLLNHHPKCSKVINPAITEIKENIKQLNSLGIKETDRKEKSKILNDIVRLKLYIENLEYEKDTIKKDLAQNPKNSEDLWEKFEKIDAELQKAKDGLKYAEDKSANYGVSGRSSTADGILQGLLETIANRAERINKSKDIGNGMKSIQDSVDKIEENSVEPNDGVYVQMGMYNASKTGAKTKAQAERRAKLEAEVAEEKANVDEINERIVQIGSEIEKLN